MFAGQRSSDNRAFHAQQYWQDPSRPYRFVPVAEFAEHFKTFSVGRKIKEDLARPPPDTPVGSTKHGEPEVRPLTSSFCLPCIQQKLS